MWREVLWGGVVRGHTPPLGFTTDYAGASLGRHQSPFARMLRARTHMPPPSMHVLSYPPHAVGSAGSCRSEMCTCAVDPDCPTGYWCALRGSTAALGGCKPMRLFGDRCSTDRECFTERCIAGRCKDFSCEPGVAQCVPYKTWTVCNATTHTCRLKHPGMWAGGHWRKRRRAQCHDDAVQQAPMLALTVLCLRVKTHTPHY